MPNKGNRPPPIPMCHPDRKHWAKGLCKQCYDADWARKNVGRANATKAKWKQNNPAQRIADRRKYLYGIDQETVCARFKAQDGLCKICGSNGDGKLLHLDHDHKTGETRSLLCGNCNRGIGLFREDISKLQKAVEYLQLWGVS